MNELNHGDLKALQQLVELNQQLNRVLFELISAINERNKTRQMVRPDIPNKN